MPVTVWSPTETQNFRWQVKQLNSTLKSILNVNWIQVGLSSVGSDQWVKLEVEEWSWNWKSVNWLNSQDKTQKKRQTLTYSEWDWLRVWLNWKLPSLQYHYQYRVCTMYGYVITIDRSLDDTDSVTPSHNLWLEVTLSSMSIMNNLGVGGWGRVKSTSQELE